MKTTIELPDDLLIEAKKRAAELRVPVRKLIEEGLRARLARKRRFRRKKKLRINWITVEGGLPQGLNVADREQMHDYLAETKS
jgi:hypothetical protein